jgi:hypothetical protein
VPAAPTLIVELDAARGHVEVDGAVVGDGVARVRVPLELPGSHRVVASAPGRRPVVRTVVVDAGATLVVPIALERVAPPPPPARSTPPPARSTPPPRTRTDKDYLLDPFGHR